MHFIFTSKKKLQNISKYIFFFISCEHTLSATSPKLLNCKKASLSTLYYRVCVYTLKKFTPREKKEHYLLFSVFFQFLIFRFRKQAFRFCCIVLFFLKLKRRKRLPYIKRKKDCRSRKRKMYWQLQKINLIKGVSDGVLTNLTLSECDIWCFRWFKHFILSPMFRDCNLTYRNL